MREFSVPEGEAAIEVLDLLRDVHEASGLCTAGIGICAYCRCLCDAADSIREYLEETAS